MFIIYIVQCQSAVLYQIYQTLLLEKINPLVSLVKERRRVDNGVSIVFEDLPALNVDLITANWAYWRRVSGESKQVFVTIQSKLMPAKFQNNTVISIIMFSEENAVKMRSFKSFNLSLRLRRFSDGINRGIDAMKIRRHPIKIDVTNNIAL